MKLARYELNGTIGYGTVSGENLNVLSGCPFGEYSETGDTVALADVQLLAPTTPTKVLAVGSELSESFGRGTGTDKTLKSSSKRLPVSTIRVAILNYPTAMMTYTPKANSSSL